MAKGGNNVTAMASARLAAVKAQTQMMAQRNQQLVTMLTQYGEVTGQFVTALRNLERHVKADYPNGLPTRLNLGLRPATRQAIEDALATVDRLLPNRSQDGEGKAPTESRHDGDAGPEGRAEAAGEQVPGRSRAGVRPEGQGQAQEPPQAQADGPAVQGQEEGP